MILPWASANLFEDNIILDLPIMIDGVSSGNVFAYNYILVERGLAQKDFIFREYFLHEKLFNPRRKHKS